MIVVKSLKKHYNGHTALSEVSLEVEPGSIVGFIGPNGSGKSTTLRIISGLEHPDAGSSRIDNEISGQLTSPWSTMGTLLDRQGVNGELTGIRALQAVASAYRVPKKEILNLLHTVDLTHAQQRKVKTFSLGMKQRLNLAIALIAQPTYLILDEPMNGLDPDGIMWLRNFLTSYRDNGGGILLSSHTLTEVEAIADRFVIIREGRTIWSGNKTELDGPDDSLVDSNDREKLYRALAKHRYDYSTHGNTIRVKNIEPADLGTILHRENVVITHLSKDRNSLEKLYLSLHSDTRSNQ